MWNWLNDSVWSGARTPVDMSMAQESLSVKCWHTQGIIISFYLLLHMFEISHEVLVFFFLIPFGRVSAIIVLVWRQLQGIDKVV